MSGGSFNYLYKKDLAEQAGLVESMAKELHLLGQHDVAALTERAAWHMREAERLREELKEVWRGVEWMCSGDTEAEYPIDEAKKWRDTHAAPSYTDASKRLHDLREHVNAELLAIKDAIGRHG